MKISRWVSRPRAILIISKLFPILETVPSREHAVWGDSTTAVRHPKVPHLKEASRVLEEATQSANC
eukprot:2220506-Pyramimonas_sp.AAC.1